ARVHDGAVGGAAQGLGVVDDQHALLDLGDAAVDVGAGEDDVALAHLGELVVGAGGLGADGALGRWLGVGDAVEQALGAVHADGGGAGQDDRPVPDGGAAERTQGAGVGLQGAQVELVHAPAVGAGGEDVEVLVQVKVLHLDE